MYDIMTSHRSLETGSELPPLKPDTVRVYNMRMCAYGQRVLLLLNYKNIPHEVMNVRLDRKPDWIRTLNPIGMVPILQVNDTLVYESMTICEYIDEALPGEKVVPADPYRKAKDRMFMELFSKTAGHFNVINKSTYGAAVADNVSTLIATYPNIEHELNTRNTKFFGGDKPTFLDFVIWPHMERIVAFTERYPTMCINGNLYPRLSRWVSSMTSLPAVQATMLPGYIHLVYSDSLKAGTPNYDVGLDI